METPPPLTGPQDPPQGSTAPLPPVNRTSLLSRLMNVFAVPGEVFDEVKASPHSASNWLVPILLLAVVGAVSAFVMFSQPAIQQQIREKQEQAIQAQVKAGKIKQADADRAMEMAQKFTGPTVMKVFGSAGAVVVSFLRVLWGALVLVLLGKWFLKAQIPFPKAMEVAGLALMIAVLGGLVTLLLTVNFSSMFATPSLALAVDHFDTNRRSHLVLGALNVFSFWLVGVLGAGLARLTGVPWARAAFLVCGWWLVQESLFILAGGGLGQMAL